MPHSSGAVSAYVLRKTQPKSKQTSTKLGLNVLSSNPDD